MPHTTKSLTKAKKSPTTTLGMVSHIQQLQKENNYMRVMKAGTPLIAQALFAEGTPQRHAWKTAKHVRLNKVTYDGGKLLGVMAVPSAEGATFSKEGTVMLRWSYFNDMFQKWSKSEARVTALKKAVEVRTEKLKDQVRSGRNFLVNYKDQVIETAKIWDVAERRLLAENAKLKAENAKLKAASAASALSSLSK